MPANSPNAVQDDGSPEPPSDSRRAARVPRLAPDHVHVGVRGPHVLGGDVPAAEVLDEPAVGAQQRLGLDGARVADDHGLAAAQVEAGGGGLVRHRARQAQDVGERVVVGRERVAARAAERGPQHRGVDGDDGPEAGRRVVEEHDLLELPAQLLEDGHQWEHTRTAADDTAAPAGTRAFAIRRGAFL